MSLPCRTRAGHLSIMRLKLADFGLATELPDGQILKDACGTLEFVAPEVRSSLDFPLVSYCFPLFSHCFSLSMHCFPMFSTAFLLLFRLTLVYLDAGGVYIQPWLWQASGSMEPRRADVHPTVRIPTIRYTHMQSRNHAIMQSCNHAITCNRCRLQVSSLSITHYTLTDLAHNLYHTLEYQSVTDILLLRFPQMFRILGFKFDPILTLL